MDSDISSPYRCIQEDFLHLNFKYLNTTFTLCKFISLIKNKEQMGKRDIINLVIHNLYLTEFYLSNFYIDFTSVLLNAYPWSATHTMILFLRISAGLHYINPMALVQAGTGKTDNFSWFEGLSVQQCTHSRFFNGKFSRYFARVHAYKSLDHMHLQTLTQMLTI